MNDIIFTFITFWRIFNPARYKKFDFYIIRLHFKIRLHILNPFRFIIRKNGYAYALVYGPHIREKLDIPGDSTP